MFQDTTDMPVMGNELDRSKKKNWRSRKLSIRNYKKNHNCYFCIRIVLQYAV